ncbi:MAG: phage tail protein [Niastella sp.]|nr:phage tail protein [Niastella sp.]
MFEDQYLANVAIFAGNFAPRGWALCQGQLISIAQNSALFSLIGTIYGGDGQVTFALPDLRSRVAIHQGQAPGRPNYVLGQVGGVENVTLVVGQLPAHTHPFVSAAGAPTVNTTAGTVSDPTNAVPALVSGTNAYAAASTGNVMATFTCNTNTVATGQNQPFAIQSPYLAMNYVICTEGIFPSRN